MRKRIVLSLILFAACAGTTKIHRVQEYRAAHARGDLAAEASYLASNARMYYEERKGEGEPLIAGGGGSWAHWTISFTARRRLRIGRSSTAASVRRCTR